LYLYIGIEAVVAAIAGFLLALRKKGRSKQNFAARFAGFSGGGHSVLRFFVFYGNPLSR
jgi:hypothetical protein